MGERGDPTAFGVSRFGDRLIAPLTNGVADRRVGCIVEGVFPIEKARRDVGVEGLPPLLAQSFSALAQVAAGVQASGVAIDELIDSRQDHPTNSLGFYPQSVPGLEVSNVEGPAGIVTWCLLRPWSLQSRSNAAMIASLRAGS